MNRNFIATIGIGIMIILMGACGDTPWNEIPRSIKDFISEYFPFGEIGSYTEATDGSSVVKIKNGAVLTFDADKHWTIVDGNGSTLPQNFIYDQLPESLYKYLEEGEQTQSVYSVSRTSTQYVVKLLDTSVEYEIATERITYPSAPERSVASF